MIERTIKFFKSITRQHLVIFGLVALVAICAYINQKYTSASGNPASVIIVTNSPKPTPKPTPGPDDTTDEGAIATFKADREQTREKELMYLDTMISAKDTTAQGKRQAESQKLQLIARMETETTLEGLLAAKDISCAVSIIDKGVNVIVEKSEVSKEDNAVILELISSQTDWPAKSVRVIAGGG